MSDTAAAPTAAAPTAAASAPRDAAPSTPRGRGGFVSRGGDRGGRGGAFRGGRGRGRGGPGADRGGAFRGGRGRGGPGARGGAGGRGRGAPGSHHHRSRTGNKRSRDDVSTNKDNRFYEDGTPVDPDAPQPPPSQQQRKEKTSKKATSDFEVLRTAFTDAASIAEFIRDHGDKRLTDAKQMNMFLQAISSRPDELYSALMHGCKAEIVVVLERMYSIYSSTGTTMPPCAQEFVIRCEQQGVRKVSWAADIPAKENEAAALLTPRDVLKRLAALHPVGRLQRLIELSRTVDDIANCVSKASLLFSPPPADVDEEAAQPSLDYATKCQLISKLASKARRLVTEPAAKAPERSTVQPTEAGTDETSAPAPTANDAPQEPTTEPAESAPAATMRELSEEERETFKNTVSELLNLLTTTLAERPSNVTMKPTGKILHFTAFCKANNLIRDSDQAITDTLDAEAEEDLAATAAQLESVITLKGLTAGDGDALLAALDAMWETGGQRHFQPHSADVLSAIATAASANGISEELRRLTSDRLVQTQLAFQSEGLQLPRRALRLVNSEQNKVKQVALAQQLEEERVARDDTMRRAAADRDAEPVEGEDEAQPAQQPEAEELTTFLDRETSSDDDDA